jgi:hypothetical protein
MASLILREAVEQTGATPETIVTNDVAFAFAALQVELTSLLGRIPEPRANEELREDNHESRHQTQLDVITGKADDLREAVTAWAEWAADQLRLQLGTRAASSGHCVSCGTVSRPESG